MKVTETKKTGLKREFKVVFPAGDIDKKVQSKLENLAQTMKVAGFRPGKVPVKYVQKKAWQGGFARSSPKYCSR